jgi:ribose 5-phosphate isomerase A
MAAVGHAFVTDVGHGAFQAVVARLQDASTLAQALSVIPGVMEHGLFIGLAQLAIIGGRDCVRLIDPT